MVVSRWPHCAAAEATGVFFDHRLFDHRLLQAGNGHHYGAPKSCIPHALVRYFSTEIADHIAHAILQQVKVASQELKTSRRKHSFNSAGIMQHLSRSKIKRLQQLFVR